MPAPSIISTTTPLVANIAYTSAVQSISQATRITGSVYSDTNGSLALQQGGDNAHLDLVSTYTVPAGTGIPIELDVIQPYLRAVYTNGNVTQTTFRLYISLQDAFGSFIEAQPAPTAGGIYMVLYQPTGSTTYSVVGRFDGVDPFTALQNAAIYNNKNGQYAAFPVTAAIVAVETLTPSATYTVASF